jgi:DNA processing protein
MDDLKYRVAFTRIPTIGTVRFRALERHFASLEDAWRASAKELRAAGLDEGAVNAILSRRASISPEGEMERLERAGVRAIHWHDPTYPPRLKEIYDPPPVLFLRGRLLPEDERSVAVVGTRKATAYGREAATTITADLARSGVTIVSGLARGIDSVAHRAALDTGGRTIAVLANGLDIVYPPEHKTLAREIEERGALLSEHPLGTRPEARHFPRRNRIMSGMTLGTLVVEAGDVSGALWTVSHALEQNREVFCIPGSIFSPASRGTNKLIQEGAKLVLDYKDVLEELNLTAVAHQMEMRAITQPVDDTETLLLGCIPHEPIHIDEVRRRSGLPIAVVSSTLAMMELKGLVRQVGGMHYIRTREASAGYAL